MTRDEKRRMPRFGRKGRAARKRYEQTHRHRRDRVFYAGPNAKDILRRIRASVGEAEHPIVGMANIRAWFLKMGYVTQTGDVSFATLKNWRLYRGLRDFITNKPSARFKWGGPWTTNFLLTAWCLTRGRELAPQWCPIHRSLRAGDGRESPSPARSLLPTHALTRPGPTR